MSEGTEPAPKPRHSIKRWRSAWGYSLNGLKYGWRHETAIREEILAVLLSFVLAPLVADSLAEGIALILSVLFVLIVEILNTAIEKTLDRISAEQHPLTGTAKDLGSLAVLLAICFSGIIWVYAILF